ncbi:MAG TPA: stalk domain-containing protein [Clostridia bacterium]
MKKTISIITSLLVTVIFLNLQVYAKSYTKPEIPPNTPYNYQLDYVVNSLLEVHPDTVDGFSEEQAAAIDAAYKKLNDRTDGWGFTMIVKEMLISFHDAHTNIFPANTRTAFYNIPLVWLKDGIVVCNDTDVLKKGDIITKIGGKTPDEILESLMKLEPNENKYTIMGNASYFLFTKPYLDYCKCKDDNGREVIECIRDNEKKTFYLPSTTDIPKRYSETRKWYGWTLYDDLSLAVFYLDEFDQYEEYKTAINNFFKEVKSKNIKNVAIDLRRNGGGDVAAVDEFLKYFNVDSLPLSSGAVLRISQKALDNSLMYSGKYNKPQLLKDSSPDKKILYYPNTKMSDGNIFKGNFYVLTSYTSFSASSHFAWRVKTGRAGTVIGEPPGNNLNQTYGNAIKLTVPNIGFPLYISTMKLYNYGTEDTVMPDVPVYTSPDDIKTGNDPQLNKLFEIVKSKSDKWQNNWLKNVLVISSDNSSNCFENRFPASYVTVDPHTASNLLLTDKDIVFISRCKKDYQPLPDNAPDILKDMDGKPGNYLEIKNGADGRLYMCIHAESPDKYQEIVDSMEDDFSPKYINFDTEDNSIKIVYKGKRLYPDVDPVIINGRTMVPMRFIFEAMGLDVKWDATTQTATGSRDGKNIVLHINDKTAFVDGNASSLDTPATIIDGRTMVPVRFIAESTGAVVDWEQNTKTVNIK